MSRTLQVNPSDAVPIWKQIEDGVRRLVAQGALGPGQAVPSVREMASDLRVNPATVSRAYQRLTDGGVLVVRRGEGTFVADAPPAPTPSARRAELSDGATRYASLALTIGARPEEARDELEKAFHKMNGKSGGSR